MSRLGPWITYVLAPTLACCALLGEEPTLDRDPLPSRFVAPWRAVALQTCVGASCGNDAPTLQSLDLRWDGPTWRVVAAIGDALHLGVLEAVTADTWALHIDATPTAAYPGALPAPPRDPAWLVEGDTAYVLFGQDDGAALHFATAQDGALEFAGTLLTAAGAGLGRVDAPSAVRFTGGLHLAYVDAAQGIHIATGPSLNTLSPMGPVLDLSDVEAPSWRDISALGDPCLRASADGLLQLFFSARGKESMGTSFTPATDNHSIGYAAASDGLAFTLFPDNPVHDQTFIYTQHADESDPAMAQDGRRGLLLYLEARLGNLPRPALALHEP